jgi:hypothetical protein
LSPGVENKKNKEGPMEFLSTSQQFYDIKGNTFKNTLIPKQTAIDSSLAFKTQGDWKTSLMSSKVKPQYKQGYVRSGQILFNNINQMNTAV